MDGHLEFGDEYASVEHSGDRVDSQRRKRKHS